MPRFLPFLATTWLAVAAAAPAMADSIDLRLKFVGQDGSPLAALPVRVAVGTEETIRLADAGERNETDTNGRFNRKLDAPIEKRKIALDNWFIRHPSNLLRLAIEIELAGRQALYVIELDQVRGGTVSAMNAWIADADGRFDMPLTFHDDIHSWSFPDDPAGMLMSGIGAELRHHELLGSVEDGWVAILVIEKQSFTVR